MQKMLCRKDCKPFPGVSGVNVFGRRYSMRIWIDPAKLSAYKLTINDIRAALDRENIELPGGKIRGNATELIVKTFGKLTTEEEFNNLIIREDNNGVVRLRMLAMQCLVRKMKKQSSRKNNVPSVNMGVVAQPGATRSRLPMKFINELKRSKKICRQILFLKSAMIGPLLSAMLLKK